MNDQPSKAPPPRLEDFPHRVNDLVRYADLDPQGHVNNAIFSTYFETGRVAMFRKPDLSIGFPGATFILVRVEIDFLKELRWPRTVEIGSAITRFGRSSFDAYQGIFDGGACAALGRATMVCIDTQSRRPRPLPEEIIASLSEWKPKA